MLTGAVLACAAVALAGEPGTAHADGRAFVNAGDSRVELLWRGQRARPTALVLRASRGGASLRVGAPEFAGLGVPPGQPLRLRDLDRNGVREAVADLTSGASGRRLSSHVVRFDPTTGRPSRTVQHWGAAGYSLRDLDRDGRPEFLSADDRFTFGARGVAVRMPLRIWSYRDGVFRDVTRAFPGRVRADMAGHWRSFAALERADAPTRAAIAAYLAGAHLLDRPAAGRARLLARFTGPADARFIAGLERRLDAAGYRADARARATR
jgi:hypothetical protein